MKKIKQKSNRSGFTLVELVITIAIVIILSVISVPIYRAYIDKSKMAEGYALLGAVLSAQKAYYSEYGNFLRYEHSVGWTSFDPSFGIDARGNRYFTWFYTGSGTGGVTADPKIYFGAATKKPNDVGKEGVTCLILRFNITRSPEWAESN